MSRSKRLAIAGLGAALWLLVFGFVMFATAVLRQPRLDTRQADGIVVLTGGQTRIEEGARLLDEGRGQRLLISGVNPQLGRETVQRLSKLDEQKFDCCVDFDNAANTIGNAAETSRWADALHYDKLIIVTASYHMPRSLAELSRAMPGKTLIPHPVLPKDLKRTPWWLDPGLTRLLVSEYVKFLPAAARLAATRALKPFHQSSLAAATAGPRAKS